MKKFLISLIVVTFGLSCTKDSGTILCGCSLIPPPEFRLIVKDKDNTDLLDQSKTLSFDKSKIKITYTDAGVKKPVSFNIRPPFTYGGSISNKFEFHQLSSTEMAVLRVNNKAQEFYIDLGSAKIDTLTFDFNQLKSRVENVKVNGALQTSEPSLPDNYGIIYFLLK